MSEATKLDALDMERIGRALVEEFLSKGKNRFYRPDPCACCGVREKPTFDFKIEGGVGPARMNAERLCRALEELGFRIVAE